MVAWAGGESVANPTSSSSRSEELVMRKMSDSLVPSGTSWGSPARRVGGHAARVLAVLVTTSLGLAAGITPSQAATTYDPATDAYSMANTTVTTGATAW